MSVKRYQLSFHVLFWFICAFHSEFPLFIVFLGYSDFDAFFFNHKIQLNSGTFSGSHSFYPQL
jgi:hypothetical protein